MQVAFQIGAYLVGLSLELAIMIVLLRGQWKRYPFVFAFLIGDFLTTVLEIEPSIGRTVASDAQKKAFAQLYWMNERIMQVLIFLLVISLVYRATERLQPRRTLLFATIAGTLAVAAISLAIHFDPTLRPGKWMAPMTRDMNFFAAILDLGLWATLIGARKKDYQLLMISGALGLQFTGVAIGLAVRQMTEAPWVVTLTGDFISMANIGCLYIWWQAFRMPVSVLPEVRRSATP